MSVVARMQCQSVKLTTWGAEVELTAVCPQVHHPHKAEIDAFFLATPVGKFTATIKNELAAEQFQPGVEFYVSLEKIDVPS